MLYLTQDLFPPGKFSKTINRNAHYIVAFKNPRDQTGIRTILLQAFPDRWRQVLRLFKRITSRPFGYLMLDVHPASDDRYRLWSHLTPEKVKRKSIPCSWMSLPFENALQRERERQRRQREGGQHTDLSARMDTPTLSPAGVGFPSASPPLDLSSMTDMVAELTRPVDRAQLDQEIEDFNISYPVNVDDAVNLCSLPPVASAGTAPATTQPITTATQTRPVTSTRTRPATTTTATSRPRPVTSTRTRPVTTATTTTAQASRTTVPARRRAGAGSRDVHHHLDGDDTQYTSQNRYKTTATTSRRTLTPLSRFIPSPVG